MVLPSIEANAVRSTRSAAVWSKARRCKNFTKWPKKHLKSKHQHLWNTSTFKQTTSLPPFKVETCRAVFFLPCVPHRRFRLRGSALAVAALGTVAALEAIAGAGAALSLASALLGSWPWESEFVGIPLDISWKSGTSSFWQKVSLKHRTWIRGRSSSTKEGQGWTKECETHPQHSPCPKRLGPVISTQKTSKISTVGISLEKTNLHDSSLINLGACLPEPNHLSSLIGEVPATVLEIGCKTYTD